MTGGMFLVCSLACDIFLPAVNVFPDVLCFGSADIIRHVIDDLAVITIMCTDPDGVKSAQYIGLCHYQLADPVEHNGIFQGRQINPAAATGTPGSSAKLDRKSTRLNSSH